MELYIEYVFIENFLVDWLLLVLTLRLLQRKISPLKTLFSALLGGLFAVVYPLLILPLWAQKTLKISVGILLSLLASKENGVGRYAINALCFLLLSAALAGVTQMLFDESVYKEGAFTVQRLNAVCLLCACLLLAIALHKSVSAIYRRKKISSFLCDCEIFIGKKSVKMLGFCDSGNQAVYRGRPVCFISPDRLLEVIEVGQVCDEMEILTVSGEKRIKIFKADKLLIYLEGKANIIENVYLSPSKNLRGQDYEALLNAQMA